MKNGSKASEHPQRAETLQDVYRTHVHLLLKLLDLAFERLHVRDEGHRVRGARRVHRMLLQLLTRLHEDHTTVQNNRLS